MNITKIETVTGRLEAVSSIKETRRPNRFMVGMKIGNDWFNSFGSEEDLNGIVSGLEKGEDVQIRFKKRGNYREAVSVLPVKQETISPASDIPFSLEFSIIKNGKLNLDRLRDAFECWKSDMDWALEELNRIESTEEKSNSY